MWAGVSASCVIDPLHDRFGDVQLKARAGAEELDLAEEDLHLCGGVGHKAEVVGIAEDELSAPVMVSKSDTLGRLEESDEGPDDQVCEWAGFGGPL